MGTESQNNLFWRHRRNNLFVLCSGCCVKQQARHFPGFPTGEMPNRVFLTVFSLDYYEFKWSKLRISSAKPDFVGQSHVRATAPFNRHYFITFQNKIQYKLPEKHSENPPLLYLTTARCCDIMIRSIYSP